MNMLLKFTNTFTTDSTIELLSDGKTNTLTEQQNTMMEKNKVTNV